MLSKKQIKHRKMGIPIGATITYEMRTGDWRLSKEQIVISRPSGETYCIRGMQQVHRTRRIRERFRTFTEAYTALLLYCGKTPFKCLGVDNIKIPKPIKGLRDY